MIPPGKTLGILGGGQLGRMTAIAAQRLGYRVHVYDASPGATAFAVAHAHRVGAFDDGAALAEFASGCDVVTYDFENLGAAPLAALEQARLLRPAARVLEICQNRMREKRWLRSQGFPHAGFVELQAGDDLRAAAAKVGFPCVLKTADFGYDGKGQRRLADAADAETFAGQVAGGGRWVVERWVDFACELSVIVARGPAGDLAVYPVFENQHSHHILDVTSAPARVAPETLRAARELAVRVAEAIGLVGLLAVELFALGDGSVIVNELAPRPHNSGHLTLEACETCQFEQHVRAVCGLPLGETRLRAPAAAMANLLGDLWQAGEPDWAAALAIPGVHLHLYGKGEPRTGRKMGHVTCLADSVEAAEQTIRKARLALTRGALPQR